jgi:hypothetical protein
VLNDWKLWHRLPVAQLAANLLAKFDPPPCDRSQLPIKVLANIKAILSGSVHPHPSTAIAICAKGMSSSLTRIYTRKKNVESPLQQYNTLKLALNEPSILTV